MLCLIRGGALRGGGEFAGTRTKRTMDKTDQTKRTTFQAKRTTSKDKTDHVPGQNEPGFRTKRTTFLDKMGPVLGRSMMFYKGLKRAANTHK